MDWSLYLRIDNLANSSLLVTDLIAALYSTGTPAFSSIPQATQGVHQDRDAPVSAGKMRQEEEKATPG
jgi:hypothetical protein